MKNSVIKFVDLLSGIERNYVKLYWNNILIEDDTSDSGFVESFDEVLDIFRNKVVYSWSCEVVDLHHVILKVIGENTDLRSGDYIKVIREVE